MTTNLENVDATFDDEMIKLLESIAYIQYLNDYSVHHSIISLANIDGIKSAGPKKSYKEIRFTKQDEFIRQAIKVLSVFTELDHKVNSDAIKDFLQDSQFIKNWEKRQNDMRERGRHAMSMHPSIS